MVIGTTLSLIGQPLFHDWGKILPRLANHLFSISRDKLSNYVYNKWKSLPIYRLKKEILCYTYVSQFDLVACIHSRYSLVFVADGSGRGG